MLAAREGHSSIVKLLLESGANVRLRDRNGDTALNIAIDNDNPDIVMQLRRAGAKAQTRKKVSPVETDDDDDDDSSSSVDELITDDSDLPPDDVEMEEDI